MREALELLDAVHLNFSKEGLFVLNITLAFIMFGVALEIKPEHFKNIALNPKSTVIGFFSQFFAMPFVTFILLILFGNFITPTIAMGMILVASCPGGNISNFMSSLAKANVALSVSLTAIATLSAVILTPLNFAIWGKLYMLVYNASAQHLLVPITIDPYEMFKTVFILLGIPLVLGMLFNNYFPKLTEKIVKPLKQLSIFIFMALVVVMFMKNYEFFLKYIKFIFIIVLIHNIAALMTGYSIGTLFKRTAQDRRTLTIETGIQNSGLALVLLFNPEIFPESIIVSNVEQPMQIGGMAFIAAWWGIWHIISGLTISTLWARVPLEGKGNIFQLLKKKK